MSDALLDPQEMEAIQVAIRETAPRRGFSAHETEPTRLALITDDRLAEAARPVLINLATRWIRSATRALRSHLPGSWQLDVVGAEILDGTAAKEELRGGWVAGLHAENGIEVVLAAHGGVIDIAAAKRCGASAPTADGNRLPSAVALRLFQPAGRAMLDSWSVAWREMFSSDLAGSSDLSIVSRLIGASTVVRVTLTFTGAVNGRLQVFARPETLIPPRSALAAIKANVARIANALAQVPVEVVVELGTLQLPLDQLRRLEPGTVLTLHGFVDSLVPVYCGGVLKAWAKPVVCRGVLAVQIEAVVHGQGPKS